MCVYIPKCMYMQIYQVFNAFFPSHCVSVSNNYVKSAFIKLFTKSFIQ